MPNLHETQLRHAYHYARLFLEANELYQQGGETLPRALIQLDSEWNNIQNAQLWTAANAAQDDEAALLCCDFPDAGSYLLELRRPSRERMRWLEAAIVAAQRLEWPEAEGVHWGNLGAVYMTTGEPRQAIPCLEKYLTVARAVEDRRAEGIALGNLGVAYFNLDDSPQALALHEQQLAIVRETEDRHSEAVALCHLGNAYFDLDEAPKAITFYEQAVSLSREISNRSSEANALFNMSLALDELGNREQTIAQAEAALKIFEETEDATAAKVREWLNEWDQ